MPPIDKTLTVPNFQTGFRHRASESLTLPGGKGVNVARARQGARPARHRQRSRRRARRPADRRGPQPRGHPQRLRPHRRRVAYVDGRHRPHQHEPDRDHRIRPGRLRRRSCRRSSTRSTTSPRAPTTWSSPGRCRGACRTTSTRRSAACWPRRRCFTVLDTYGEPLRLGVRGHPDFVTPNMSEAEDLVGHEFHDDQDIIDATELICELGAAERDHQVARRLLRAHPARPPPIASTTRPSRCSRRRQHGRLRRRVPGRLHRRPFPERTTSGDCLRCGLACGAANTQRYGAGVFDAGRGRATVRDDGGDRGRLRRRRLDCACLAERGARPTPRPPCLSTGVQAALLERARGPVLASEDVATHESTHFAQTRHSSGSSRSRGHRAPGLLFTVASSRPPRRTPWK